MKTNFHNKNFALSFAFIMRFTATRKWPIFDDRLDHLRTAGFKAVQKWTKLVNILWISQLGLRGQIQKTLLSYSATRPTVATLESF